MCNICIPLLSCNKVCNNISTNEGLSIRLLYESCVTALHFSLELKMFKLCCLWFCKAPTCYFYDCLPCWQCFRLASVKNSNSDTQLSFFFLSTWQCFSLSIWSRWGFKAQITCIRWKIELQSSKALHVLITVRGCICSNHRFWRRNIDMTIVILKHCDHCS